MKTSIIRSFIFLFTISVTIQNGYSQKSENKTDTLKENKSILSREFSRIVTGNSFSSIGNFASISTDEKTLNASAFFLFKDYNILNLKFSGGATQGIATVFQEGKLNGNIGFDISYNVMLRKLNKEKSAVATIVNQTEISSIQLAILEEERKFQKKRVQLLNGVDTKKHQLDLKTLDDSLKKINAFLKTRDSVIKARENNNEPLYKITSFLDSVNKFNKEKRKIETVRKQINKLQQQKEKYPYSKLSNIYRIEKHKKVQALSKKLNNLKSEGVSFSWISFGYGFTHDSFSLFDESLPLSEQLSRQNYSTQRVTLSYNHQSNINIDRINSNINPKDDFTRGTLYISAGAKLEVTNNLSSLEEVEIVDARIVDPTTGRERVVKQNAFAGNYQDNLTNGLIYVDYLRFFSSKEDIAIHMKPTILMRENFKPISSFQIGVVFPFKDVKQQNTIVNLEIFYRSNDIFNTSNSNKSILNRNSIGLQASFPFSL